MLVNRKAGAAARRVEVDVIAEEREDLEVPVVVFTKTVDIFAALLGRKILLKEAPSAWTNRHVIYAPLTTDGAYAAVEHLLAHLVFDTDPHARGIFVSMWATQVAEALTKENVTVAVETLEHFLGALIDVLENERVNDLWRRIYPGSYEAIKTREKTAATGSDLLGYMVSIYVNRVAPPSKFDRLAPAIYEAFRRVQGRTFATTLATARWLVVQMVDEVGRILDNVPPPGYPKLFDWDAEHEIWEPDRYVVEASRRATNLATLLRSYQPTPQLLAFAGDVQRPEVDGRGVHSRAMEVAAEAMEADPSGYGFLAAEARAADRLLARAQEAVGQPKDVALRKAAQAKVVFHDAASDKPPLPPFPQEDESTVKRLRVSFQRVLGRARQRLEETGSEVDVPSAIERRIRRVVGPVFRHVERGQGFRCLVLLDKSESMKRSGNLDRAYRACRVISRALAFPFVRLDVWGFTSVADGQVDIARFDPSREVYETEGADFTGATPIHLALSLARAELSAGSEVKHIVCVTDGVPSFAGRDGRPFHFRYLIEQVRREVTTARQHGIGVTGLFLPDDDDDLDRLREKGNRMFGSSRHWRFVEEATFGRDLIKAVSTSFSEYLLRR